MGKDLRGQQKTDAGRIGEAGTGKLDQQPPAERRSRGEAPARPAGAAADLTAVRARLEEVRRAAVEQLQRLRASPEMDEHDGRGGSVTAF